MWDSPWVQLLVVESGATPLSPPFSLDQAPWYPPRRLSRSNFFQVVRDEQRRCHPGHLGGHLAQARTLPFGARHAEHDDVVDVVAVPVPRAQDALAAEAHALERDLRAAVARVGPGGEAAHAERLEAERGHQRLGLEVRAAAPPLAPEPRADRRAAVAPRELGQPGDADRPMLAVVDEKLEHLAAVALAGQLVDVGQRLADARVRAPGEEARDERIGAELEQPRRVLRGRVAQRERRARD